MKRLLIFILFTFCLKSYSKEFSYLARSPRALLMGDAYTAIADDEYTLFYNPAAMARHRGIHTSLMNPKIELPDVFSKNLKEMKFSINGKYKNWPKEPVEITRRIIGTPLHLGVSVMPTLKFENFAISWINSSTTDLILMNQVHPTLGVNYRYDRGMVFGAGFPIFGNGGKKASSQLSAGISLKKLDRSSLVGSFDLFGTELLEIIENSDNYKEIRKALGYSKGSGWGWDIGLEQSFNFGPSKWILGLSVMDIGDTRFKKDEGINEIPVQKMSTNLGTSFSQDFGFFDYGFSMDLSPVFEPQVGFLTKLKLGFSIAIPGIELLMGVNGGHWSYGLGFDIFIFKLTAGFYGIESGRKFKDIEAKRLTVTLNLLNIGFEP